VQFSARNKSKVSGARLRARKALTSLRGIYEKLSGEHLAVLRAVESKLRSYEYVPADVIAAIVKLPPKKLDEILADLVSMKLLRRRLGYEVGYKLLPRGLDVLALDSLIKRGVVAAIGEKVSVGKESDIYEAFGPSQERLAIKFYRVGRTSFKRTKKLRPYVLERDTKDWLEESKLSAEREFKALRELSAYTEHVPKPVAYSRHAVVTLFVDGVELYKVKELEDPGKVLNGILEVVKVAYSKVGIVHGDLSEYNVLVAYPGEEAFVIDWPQYIYRDQPQALEALRRDVAYVAKYFAKRFGLEIDVEQFVSEVLKGEG